MGNGSGPCIPAPIKNGASRIGDHFQKNAVIYIIITLLTVWMETKTEDRFTGREGEKLELRVRIIEGKLATLPPRDLLQRVTRLEATMDFLTTERIVEQNGR